MLFQVSMQWFTFFNYSFPTTILWGKGMCNDCFTEEKVVLVRGEERA